MRRTKEVDRLSDNVQIRVERGETVPITLTAREETLDVFYAAAEPGGCVANRYNADLNFPLPFAADALPFHSTVHVEYMDSNSVERTYTRDIVEASSGSGKLSLETGLSIRDPYPRRDYSFGRAWLTWNAQTVTGTDDHGEPVSFRVAAGSTSGVFSGEAVCNIGIKKLSAPTYNITNIRANYAWVEMTCCIRECGETCGVHIPSPGDEYDECSYEILVAGEGEGWKDAGRDLEELVPDTKYYVIVRTVDMPNHRCEASDWVLKEFRTLTEAGGTRITATSDIPLYYSDDSNGPQIVPCSSRVVWDQDNQICDGRYPADECWEGDHVISSLTFLADCGIVTRNLSEGSMYDRRYSGTVTADTNNNTLHINLTNYPYLTPTEECAVNITTSGYEIYLSDVPGTEGTRIGYTPIAFNCLATETASSLFECKKYITVYKNPSTPPVTPTRMLCIQWADIVLFKYGAGDWELDEVKSSSGMDIFGRRTTSSTGISMPIERCYVEGARITVDIPASIAAGGIPETIKTGNDAQFTFIVRNDTANRVAVAVSLSFRGVDIAKEYPRDITGLVEKPGGGYGPPGSDAFVWDNGFLSPDLLYIAPNTSMPYTLTVWLPDEAIPAGRAYANYTIHTVLKKY